MRLFWIFKGIRAAAIIMGKVPVILEDGKVTVEEIVDLLAEVLEVFDLPMSFALPEEIKDQVIAVKATD